MDWITGIQNALDYIEENITEELDYEEIAKRSFSSSYHFQRVFSIMCGYTLGDYIRNRRLSLAGAELNSGKAKVLDIALKYGYDSPDSFTKAFYRFHGVRPSEAREPGVALRSFSPLSIKISLEGGTKMKYRIETRPEMILTGYKRHFTGIPYGEERSKQEGDMFIQTRALQWILLGSERNTDMYCVVTNITEEGYDFYLAAPVGEWTRSALRDKNQMGIDPSCLGFEDIVIPEQTCVVFETEQTKYPTQLYLDLRTRIVTEWFPSSGYEQADAPEIVIYHYRNVEDRMKKYIEISIPIVKS